jgi:hypothetical protein
MLIFMILRIIYVKFGQKQGSGGSELEPNDQIRGRSLLDAESPDPQF